MSHPGLTVREADMLSVVRAWATRHRHWPKAIELLGVVDILREELEDSENAVPGPVRVNVASAVVAYRDGVPVGVAYRVESGGVE